MSEPNSTPDEGDRFRQVLHQWEREQARAPAFDVLHRRIARSPSLIDTPRWSVWQSARLTAVLAWAQLKVVPWLVLPVALVFVTMAILAARFFGVTQGGTAGNAGFATVMLAGVVATITMALSSSKADSIAMGTPIGPQVVVLARVAVVLTIDAVIGIAASSLVSAWGYTSSLPELVASWLCPVALVAGAATFAAIWIGPVTGGVAGVLLIPMAAPLSDAMFFFGLSGLLWNVLTPPGVLVAGMLLLGVAVASARQAAVSRLQSA